VLWATSEHPQMKTLLPQGNELRDIIKNLRGGIIDESVFY